MDEITGRLTSKYNGSTLEWQYKCYVADKQGKYLQDQTAENLVPVL